LVEICVVIDDISVTLDLGLWHRELKLMAAARVCAPMGQSLTIIVVVGLVAVVVVVVKKVKPSPCIAPCMV